LSVVIVDASTALAWCFPDEANAISDGILFALRGQTLMVPAIWSLEIANTVLVAERRGRLKLHQVNRFLELLAEMDITEQSQSVGDAIRNVLPLAHQHNLTAYDAAYLDLSARQGAPLATFDSRLQKACRSAGIEIFAA
jgi:predicted nucleic acid-binding protein